MQLSLKTNERWKSVLCYVELDGDKLRLYNNKPDRLKKSFLVRKKYREL